jgi:choline-glycine betaine transporter
LEEDEIMVFFVSIFKQSMTLVLDRLKNWVSGTEDIYALLIMKCLIIQSKEGLLKRKFHALDHYIGNLNKTSLTRLSTPKSPFCYHKYFQISPQLILVFCVNSRIQKDQTNFFANRLSSAWVLERLTYLYRINLLIFR